MSTAIRSIDGLPVIDAKHDLELEIVSRDCKGGDPLRPESCAAARAARRQFDAYDVRIHLTRVYIRTNKGNWQRYIASDRLHQEVIVFDRGGEMMPGKYMLLSPKKSQRIGQYHKGKKSARATKKHRKHRFVERVRAAPTGD